MNNSENFKENAKVKCNQVHLERKMQSDAKKVRKLIKCRKIKKL